ncbi:MAG: hypothetical protein Q8R55_07505 [Candidatus Taylorbacteria bacterium]|nr:hypothetical protein [Candidatus Taylorbacteria bacterium]
MENLENRKENIFEIGDEVMAEARASGFRGRICTVVHTFVNPEDGKVWVVAEYPSSVGDSDEELKSSEILREAGFKVDDVKSEISGPQEKFVKF